MLEGALAADAATMGLHWFYDTSAVRELLRANASATPEFFEPPSSPYYTAPPGDPTPYGDELVAQLRGMAAEPGGAFAPVAFARAYLSYARDGCFADSACRRSRLNGVSKWWLECMVGSPVGEWEKEWNAGHGVRLADAGAAGRAAAAREDETALAAGRWRDCPPREERAENNQAHAVVKAIAIAARHAAAGGGDDGALRLAAEQAVRMLQDNADAVKHGVAAAALLARLLEGATAGGAAAGGAAAAGRARLRRALAWLADDSGGGGGGGGGGRGAASPLPAADRRAVAAVLARVRRAGCDAPAQAHHDAVDELGSACELPGMFLSSVHGMATAEACAPPGAAPDVAAAVRATILAGGDQASRSMFIAAALVAAGSAVPPGWAARSAAVRGEGLGHARAVLAAAAAGGAAVEPLASAEARWWEHRKHGNDSHVHFREEASGEEHTDGDTPHRRRAGGAGAAGGGGGDGGGGDREGGEEEEEEEERAADDDRGQRELRRR